MTVIASKKLRDSARDEECTFEIAGVCCGDSATVVLCHLPSDLAGYKSTDISAAFGCHTCHSVIDSRDKLSGEDYEFYCRRAMVRTWTRWIETGLVQVKGVA